MAKANETPPANLSPVRSPNTHELNQLWNWFKKHDLVETYLLEERNWHDSFYIAVFDDYCTGCPGYCGKVLYLVWDGAPSFCTVFTFDRGKLVLEGEHGDACCSGRPAFDAAPALLKALRHAYGRLNDIPHDYRETDFKLLQEALARAEGRAEIVAQGRRRLLAAWCRCPDFPDEPLYLPDNTCECGEWKHHYHCPSCRGISQVG